MERNVLMCVVPLASVLLGIVLITVGYEFSKPIPGLGRSFMMILSCIAFIVLGIGFVVKAVYQFWNLYKGRYEPDDEPDDE